MRLAPFLLLSLAVVGHVTAQFGGDEDRWAPEFPSEPEVPALPTARPADDYTTLAPMRPTRFPREKPIAPREADGMELTTDTPTSTSYPYGSSGSYPYTPTPADNEPNSTPVWTTEPPTVPSWWTTQPPTVDPGTEQPTRAPIYPSDPTATPTYIPTSYPYSSTGGYPYPTMKPYPVSSTGRGPVPVEPAQHCPRYLAHAACRQCVSQKGSLGFTPISDLHFCPSTGGYDHLGACLPITTSCGYGMVGITNITACPNDVAESKPSCGACTGDAYVWCQDDASQHDEYMGICRDATHLFRSRRDAQLALAAREMRSEDDLTMDVIDRLCGPTHTAIISRRSCPRRHSFRTGRLMMAILFHMIPILLCFSACCLCIRAVKKRRQARNTPLLDGPVPAPSAPVAASDYPGVQSISYPSNAALPVPLPNGSYMAPAPTAPATTIPMQTFYPTLSAPPASLRAPLLEQPGNSDGLIYGGHVYGNGYSRVQREI